jgi:hypothetical protein
MGIFDKAKQKAEELAGQHSDKVEEHSDRGLDMAADRANQATGGKYADHVDTARGAADDRIGETGAAEHAADENPMVDDPDRVDPQR